MVPNMTEIHADIMMAKYNRKGIFDSTQAHAWFIVLWHGLTCASCSLASLLVVTFEHPLTTKSMVCQTLLQL